MNHKNKKPRHQRNRCLCKWGKSGIFREETHQEQVVTIEDPARTASTRKGRRRKGLYGVAETFRLMGYTSFRVVPIERIIRYNPQNITRYDAVYGPPEGMPYEEAQMLAKELKRSATPALP